MAKEKADIGSRSRQQPPSGWYGDLMGGLSAMLSGLPVELNYGLILLAPMGVAYGSRGILMTIYACIAAGLVSAVAGSRAGVINGSRPGIVIILSTLVAHALEVNQGNDVLPIVLAQIFACTLLVGLFQMGFGLIRIGQVIRYMPYPVLAGLTNGIALLMVLSAIPAILGKAHAGDVIKPLSLLVALVTLYFSFRRPAWLRKLPRGIPALVLGTGSYYVLQSWGGGALLGGLIVSVPSALPSWQWAESMAVMLASKDFWQQTIPSIWSYAFAISALASMEALVTATSADNMLYTRHNSDRELAAQGAGNVAAAFFGGVPTAPTLARLTANVGAGGNSRLSSIFYSLWMLLALLTVMNLVGHVPAAVPAAVLLAIGIGMVDSWTIGLVPQLLFQRSKLPAAEYRRIWGHFGIMLLVMVLVVGSGLIWAVGVGALSAVLVFVKSSIKSVVRRQYSGHLQYSLRVRPAEQVQYLERHGGKIIVLELEGILFFGTTARLSSDVEQAVESAQYLVLDMRRIVEIDATGARTLHQLASRLRMLGKVMMFSSLSAESTRGRFLISMGLENVLPRQNWFSDTDTALEYCEDLLLESAFSRDTGSAFPHGELPLSRLGLAKGLNDEQFARLEKHLHRYECAGGQVIFHVGDQGDRLFLVAKGSVSIRLSREGEAKDHQRIAAFGPGVMFGEMALLDGKARSANALADEDSVLYYLERSSVDLLRSEDAELVGQLLYNIATELAERLRTTTMALRELSEQ